MVRISFITILLFFFSISFSRNILANEDRQFLFVPGFEDLPLMRDLEEGKFETNFFDSPYGRIVESTVIVDVSAQDIRKFYNLTLPQLGWSQFEENYFLREKEILNLHIEKIKESGLISVKFFLSPKDQ